MADTTPHLEKLIEVTVVKTLLSLGLDVSDPETIIELQKDFAYVRSWRQSVAEVKSKGFLALCGIALTGFVGLMWTAFKSSLH